MKNTVYNKEQSELLARAVMGGELAGVVEALSMGADPDFQEAWSVEPGWPFSSEKPGPLHMACRRGDADIVKALLKAGADLEMPSGNQAPVVRWLSGGLNKCAGHWIRAGGNPWKVYTFPDGCSTSLALEACRGGEAELWSLMAQSVIGGGDGDLDQQWVDGVIQRVFKVAAPSFRSNVDLEGTVVGEALEWCNMAAVEALASVGWVPSQDNVAAVAKKWSMGSVGKQESNRIIKCCERLFELGAALPDESYFTSVGLYCGEKAKAELCGLLRRAYAKVQSKIMSKAARPGKPSANKIRGSKPRL